MIQISPKSEVKIVSEEEREEKRLFLEKAKKDFAQKVKTALIKMKADEDKKKSI
jgi:hypothetical protein